MDLEMGTDGSQCMVVPKQTRKWELMDPNGWMSAYGPGNGN